jgi:hypothetical protein
MSPSPDTPPTPWCPCVAAAEAALRLAALRNHRLASRFSAAARRKEVLHAAQAKAVQIGIPVIIAVVDGGGYPWSSETDTDRSAGRPGINKILT